MGETAKDVRLHVTLDNGEHLFLPGEAVTLDADKADALIREGKARVRVLPTCERWFGVTYKEDKQVVVDSIQALIQQGVYKEKLF